MEALGVGGAYVLKNVVQMRQFHTNEINIIRNRLLAINVRIDNLSFTKHIFLLSEFQLSYDESPPPYPTTI